jgi:hypothetical protein
MHALLTWHTCIPIILPLISHLITNLIAQLPIQVVVILTLLREIVQANHLHCSKQAVE